MRLTKKRAIDLSIELWERMAKYGCEHKHTWSRFKEFDDVTNCCFLCEYAGMRDAYYVNCKRCPLGWGDYGCEESEDSYYAKWLDDAKTKEDRKKYAKLFLEQLRTLK